MEGDKTPYMTSILFAQAVTDTNCKYAMKCADFEGNEDYHKRIKMIKDIEENCLEEEIYEVSPYFNGYVDINENEQTELLRKAKEEILEEE
jgi:hypothetical protein